MDFQTKIRELIKTLLENMHEKRKMILALSCFVVFLTTYMLILPAFTLDKEEASEQGGIDVPGVEQSDEADSAAKEDVEPGAKEEIKTDAKKTEISASTDSEKPTADSEDKSKDLPKVTLVNDENEDFVVAVEGEDGGLSEGMSIEVREIVQSDKKQEKEYESLYNDALEAVQKAQKEEGLEKTSDFAFAKFYDISLIDGKKEIEPDSAVDVKISFGQELQKELEVTDPDKVHIVHFAADKETGEVIPEVLNTDTTDITVENNKVTEAAFTADSFSVFAVVYSKLTTDVLTADGKVYKVTVAYDEDAQIPEDAWLKVTPYDEDSEEHSSIRNTILEQSELDQEDVLRTLDISIVGADGQEIEPKTPVRVEMVIKDLNEETEYTGGSLTVLHLDESSGDVKVEAVADTGEMGNIQLNEETATASFTLDSFSQFAIRYGNYVQVNVHYVDANGNELAGRTDGVAVYNNSILTLADYSNRMTQSGYTYLSAHYGSSSGQLITSLRATQSPTEGSLVNSGQSITFYNGTEAVARQEYESTLRQVDVYLVYAPSSGYYILDTIGADGCLAVHDEDGLVQTGADQNLFVRWYRSNGTTDFEEVTQSKILNGNYNIPELDGPKVNVSIDEGANQYYYAEIYEVEDNEEVVLATTKTYHVPYYDDVQNGGFETPHNNGTTDESVNRWPSNWQVENGQNGVVWKTTGMATDGSKRDIEIPQGADADGNGANNLGETLRNYCFAFMPEGNQCAELNCEAAGALYQDVLTIPGSQLYWSLYHRARGAYDKWKNRPDKTQNQETDTMYVVAMPKELAEKYDVTTQEKVLEIVQHVNDPNSEFHDVEIVEIKTTNQGNGIMTFMNTGASLTVPPTYFGNLDGRTAIAYDGTTRLTYGDTDWHYYTGNFSIPQDQYLTRFFFVAGDTASNDNTMGNFLDGISMSDSVPTPNHGQATAIIQKTVKGLKPLPDNYATRIETTYETTKHNTVTTPTDKNSDYDHYRTDIDAFGNAVSTASWTFPISIDNGDKIVFTKGEEKDPVSSGKTDVVEGYTQTTSYILRKQSSGEAQPSVVAEGSGKVIPEEDISKLTVNEKDIIYIEFINTYKPKRKISICKTDPAGNVIQTGASFELYTKDDFDDTTQEPKENAAPIASGTTGTNGILYLEELEEGEYRLLETEAPDGFDLLDSAVKIFITDKTVTALIGPNNLTVLAEGDEGWIEGQAAGTTQINVWNNPGVELPHTGGIGTTIFYILGSILVIGGGIYFVSRRRMK